MRAYVAIMFSVMAVSVVFAQRPGGSDQRRQRQPMENRQRQPGGGGDAMLEPKASTGLIPLVDMGPDVFHHGEDGGLYGEGRNTPPEEHLRLAMKAASQIQPLDSQGRPSPDGRIVLVSSGMSNTRMKFQAFQSLSDPTRHLALVLVNGAQGGRHASTWQSEMVWAGVDRQLTEAGVTAQQVQVMWMLHAIAGPSVHGEFPAHARKLKEFTEAAVHKAAARYPNLKLIYLSSRTYAGYASRGLNPEPYAYESAYAVRWLIREQMAGRPGLNTDPAKGSVRGPVLLWGPYLWADGEKGRSIDSMVWSRQDYAGDGTHPSASGNRKVAEQMRAFFGADPTAVGWYSGSGQH